MTLKETAAVMSILKIAYPRYYSGLGANEARETVTLWQNMLCDYSAETVTFAVKAIIATNKFPPTIADVIEKINKLSGHEVVMSEVEAWGLVKNAIRNSTYHSEDEFAKLPDAIKATLGRASVLKEWANSDDSSMETVIASNFMRSYKSKNAELKEVLALPKDLQNMITQYSRKTMIEG